MKKTYDYLVNILSSILPVIVLQIFIYPILSSSLSIDAFGDLLVLVTVVTIISMILGNTLNNIRLVNKDKASDDLGSYNLILFAITILSLVFINLYVFIFTDGFIKENYILINIWLVAFLIKSYLLVEFRLTIDFLRILYTALFGVLGYLFGLFIYNISTNFLYIFMFTEIFSLTYVLVKTKYNFLHFDSLKNFKKIFFDYLKLFLANLISNVTNYFDRFALLILLGSMFVAEFFVSTFIAKSVALILYPITNVILTYSVGKENQKSKKDFNKLFIICLIVVFISYFIIVGLSYLLIPILYGEIFYKIADYIWVTNFAVLLFSSTKVIQTLIISKGLYSDNFKLNLNTFLILLVMSIPLTYYFGVVGYSVSLITASLYKYIHIYIISRIKYD